MNISKRTSVERPSSKNQPQHNWIPHPHLPKVYIHRISNKQIQAHLLNIPHRLVENQSALIAGRINNKHPFVCCAHFYQQMPQQQQSHQTNPNTLHSIVVYTDRVIPLQEQDWTKLNIFHGLIGIKRLVMTYGPIKITERNFGKDENGEIKVWISSNSQKNRPDFPLFNEHETISSLIESLKAKNPAVIDSLNGSLTLREAIDKLAKSSAPTKGKHRYTPSIGTYLPTEPPLRPTSDYAQNYTFSDFRSRQRASREKSNSEHFLFNSLWKSKEKIVSKSKQKMKGVQTAFPNRSVSFFNPNQGKFFGLDSIHELNHEQSNRFSGPSNRNLNGKFKLYPETPQSRANGNGSSFSKQYFFSHRGGQPSWREHAESHFPKQSYDITIINNNVSNYISNFHKNHKAGPESADRAFREEAKTPYFAWNTRQNSPKKDYKRKGVPSFISKKQGVDSNTQSQQNSNQGTRVLIGTNKPGNNQVSMDNREKDQAQQPVEIKRRKEPKFFTFCSNEPSVVPEATNYFTPKARQNHQAQSSGFKKPDRAIRAQSNYNPSQSMRSKSKEAKRTSLEDYNGFIENAVSNQRVEDENDRMTRSNELKQAMRRQYNHLLNFELQDCINEETQSNLKNESFSDSEEKKSLMKESLLKDKIQQKKQAFAELKKEALKVLTDF